LNHLPFSLVIAGGPVHQRQHNTNYPMCGCRAG
jgi:hypothetical protein